MLNVVYDQLKIMECIIFYSNDLDVYSRKFAPKKIFDSWKIKLRDKNDIKSYIDHFATKWSYFFIYDALIFKLGLDYYSSRIFDSFEYGIKPSITKITDVINDCWFNNIDYITDRMIWNYSSLSWPLYRNNYTVYDKETFNHIKNTYFKAIDPMQKNIITNVSKYDKRYKIYNLISHMIMNNIGLLSYVFPIIQHDPNSIISYVFGMQAIPNIMRSNDFDINLSYEEVCDNLNCDPNIDFGLCGLRFLYKTINICDTKFMFHDLIGICEYMFKKKTSCNIYSSGELYQILNNMNESDDFFKKSNIVSIYSLLKNIKYYDIDYHSDEIDVKIDDIIDKYSSSLRYNSDMLTMSRRKKQEVYKEVKEGSKQVIYNIIKNGHLLKEDYVDNIFSVMISSFVNSLDKDELCNIIVGYKYHQDINEQAYCSRKISYNGNISDYKTYRLNIGRIFRSDDYIYNYNNYLETVSENSILHNFGVPIFQFLMMRLYLNCSCDVYKNINDDEDDEYKHIAYMNNIPSYAALSISSKINLIGALFNEMLSYGPISGILIPSMPYEHSMPFDAYNPYNDNKLNIPSYQSDRNIFHSFFGGMNPMKKLSYTYRNVLDIINVFDFMPSFICSHVSQYRNRCLAAIYPYCHELTMDHKIGTIATMLNASGVMLHNISDLNPLSILFIQMAGFQINEDYDNKIVTPASYYRTLISSIPEMKLDLLIGSFIQITISPGSIIYGNKDYVEYELSIVSEKNLIYNSVIDADTAFHAYLNQKYYGINCDFLSPVLRVLSMISATFQYRDDSYLFRKSALARLLHDEFLYMPQLSLCYGNYRQQGTQNYYGVVNMDTDFYSQSHLLHNSPGFGLFSMCEIMRNQKNSIVSMIANIDVCIHFYDRIILINPIDAYENIYSHFLGVSNSHLYQFGLQIDEVGNNASNQVLQFMDDNDTEVMKSRNLISDLSKFSFFAIPNAFLYSSFAKNYVNSISYWFVVQQQKANKLKNDLLDGTRNILNILTNNVDNVNSNIIDEVINQYTETDIIDMNNKIISTLAMASMFWSITSSIRSFYWSKQQDYEGERLYKPNKIGIINIYRKKIVNNHQYYCNEYKQLPYISIRYKNQSILIYTDQLVPSALITSIINLSNGTIFGSFGLAIYDHESEKLTDFGGMLSLFNKYKNISGIRGICYQLILTISGMFGGSSRVFSKQSSFGDENQLDSKVSSMHFITVSSYIKSYVVSCYNNLVKNPCKIIASIPMEIIKASINLIW